MDAGGAAHHSLPPAEGPASGRHNSEFMAESAQLPANIFGNEGFDIHVTSVEGGFGEASGFQSFLYVEVEVCDVGDELSVCLRLVEPSHDPKADAHSILFHEPRNDRVQWPLARLEHVGMILFECEERAAVLQHESGSGRYQT